MGHSTNRGSLNRPAVFFTEETIDRKAYALTVIPEWAQVKVNRSVAPLCSPMCIYCFASSHYNSLAVRECLRYLRPLRSLVTAEALDSQLSLPTARSCSSPACILPHESDRILMKKIVSAKITHALYPQGNSNSTSLRSFIQKSSMQESFGSL